MKPEDMDLKKLRAFELVAREGSLRGAGQRLNLTTSAISFCIRRLEEDLGVELFERLPNKLVLTPAGRKLLNETAKIRAAVGGAIAAVSTSKTVGDITIAACNSAVISYLTPRISTFMTNFPSTKMALQVYRSSDALDLVSSGKIDICLGHFANVPGNLECKLIFESSLSLGCPSDHPLLQADITLAAMAGYTLITLPPQTMTRLLVEKSFSEFGVQVSRYIEAGNCQAARALAMQGVGVAVIHSLCAKPTTGEKLCFVDLDNLFHRMSFHAVHRKGANSSAIYDVLRALTSDDLYKAPDHPR